MANVGQAVFAVLGAVVGTFCGGNTMLGFSLGLMLGGMLFPTEAEDSDTKVAPSSLQLTSTQYGIPLPVIFGTRKVAGNLIWYGNFQTIMHEEGGDVGGKGGSAPGGQSTYYYTYTCSFAVGVGVGYHNILAVQANSKLVGSTLYVVHNGTQVVADSHMSYVLGLTDKRVPVWKNFCYVVFPNFDLGTSPNLPNITIEVQRGGTPPVLGTQVAVSTFHLGGPFCANYEKMWCVHEPYTHGWYEVDIYTNVGTYKSSAGLPYGCSVLNVKRYGPFFFVGGRSAAFQEFGVRKVHTGVWIMDENFTVVGIAAYEKSTRLSLSLSAAFINDAYIGIAGSDSTTSPTKYYLWVVARGGEELDTFNETPLITWTSPTIPGAAIMDKNLAIHILTTTHKQKWRWSPSKQTWVYATQTAYAGSGYPCIAYHAGAHKLWFMSYEYNSRAYEYNPETLLNTGRFVYTGGGWPKTASWMFFQEDKNYMYFGISEPEWSMTNVVCTDYDALDWTPQAIVKSILTNPLYGLGLDATTYLDAAAELASEEYCIENDLLLSMVFNSQTTYLDCIQYVLQHHDGFLTYANGKFAHRQFMTEASTVSYTNDYPIQDGEEFAVQITKKGATDYYNKIVVEYTNRRNKYSVSTVADDDQVDINKYGTKLQTVKLDGLATDRRAKRLAATLLKRSLSNPEYLSFKAGPALRTLQPGQVFDYTDADVGLTAKLFRALNISQNRDMGVEITAMEELDFYPTSLEPPYINPTNQPGAPAFGEEASAVVNLTIVELPARLSVGKYKVAFLFTAPDEEQWGGVSVYKAYSTGGLYTKVKSIARNSVTGTVDAVAIVSEVATITVTLDKDYTLVSATSFDDLMVSFMKNLCVFIGAYGSVYVRFQTATLVSGNQWKLSGLIYDCLNAATLNSYGAIVADDVFGFYTDPEFAISMVSGDIYRTLYFKVPSYNMMGTENDLANVTEMPKALIGVDATPLAPYDLKVNGQIAQSDGKFHEVLDFVLTWLSRSRYGEDENTYQLGCAEDADFTKFTLTFATTGGTTLRTVDVTDRTYTYTAAMYAEDGSPAEIVLSVQKFSGSAVSAILTGNIVKI